MLSRISESYKILTIEVKLLEIFDYELCICVSSFWPNVRLLTFLMTVWRITGKIIRTTIMLITYAHV